MMDIQLELEELFRSKPHFHTGEDGTAANWGLSRAALTALAAELKEGMTTLETGAGYSTVLFAAAGADHTAIMMSQDEADKIAAYCQQRNIRIPKLIAGFSDRILPSWNDLRQPLDLVFIDGGHAYPVPQIDWFYTQSRLRVGGLFVLDDIQIPAVRSLHDFLMAEKEWELVKSAATTSFFRKLADEPYPRAWMDQGINRPLIAEIEAGQRKWRVRIQLYLASIPWCKAVYRKYFKRKTN